MSVILPAYNRASTLRRAIASVLAQEGAEDLELIVVDDASTDSTQETMSAINDPRIRYHRRQYNGGAAAARNSGLALARGGVVTFIDSDDEWLPQKLAKQLSVLRASGPETGLVLCGLVRWDTRQAHYLPDPRRRHFRETSLRNELLRQNFALTSSWCLRREVFDRVGGFDESLRSLVDWEWLIRYTALYPASVIDEPLVMVYASPDSISGREPGYIRSLERVIAKHETGLRAEPRSLSNLYYVLGKKHMLYQDPAKGRKSLLTALRINPGDPRIWLALILSVMGARRFTSVWRQVRRAKGFEV